MSADRIEYLGHHLTIVEQRGGGYLVEIAPPAGGPSIRTQTYPSTQEAIAKAKTTIEMHPGRNKLIDRLN
ncbi:hypothetical protein [Bradyrhizobium sp. Ce-3]|uniref:hypothetical protein n=1 Tax=Bradyrhizobium sp. Ce-3 TaxID=2913970 RepID=UPI001FB909B2|nr:hypothetical protein [Bradyrhizobium sp. Ce-3]